MRSAMRKPWHGLPRSEQVKLRRKLDPEYRRYDIMRSLARKWRMKSISDGTVTASSLRTLRDMVDICYLCGLPMLDRDKSFDHVFPVSRGGINSINNLTVTHLKCNIVKSDKILLASDSAKMTLARAGRPCYLPYVGNGAD